MYLTCTEWTALYGGKKGGKKVGDQAEFRRLPFDHCSLSLQPYEHPLCSPEGHIFDLMNIVPYLKKYNLNPVTGKPLEAKALVKLNIHKNAEGHYHCPVLFKEFNNNSHVVAIKTTGNVFSHEAVDQLNFKTKNLKDLLCDEPFKRTDVIMLQDPSDLEKFNLAKFHHLQNNLKVEDEEEERAKKDPKYHLKTISKETATILAELDRDYKPQEKKPEVKKKMADEFNAAHYSTGAVSAGFTSTIMEPTTKHESAVLRDDVVLYSRVKKKGYVSIVTNLGTLNLEIHCDMVPKTCENFVKLCLKGYYDNTIFHRSIKNFMIQGGDPTGTGKGGDSIWERNFKDEFKPNLTHTGRGILSMANSGPNTNKSQFFITYRSCRHLDSKHSVFGRVVGGLDTLSAMEKVEVDAKDKPKVEIRLERTTVFVDPFAEAEEQLRKDREEAAVRDAEQKGTQKAHPSDTPQAPKVFKKGVGKYINPSRSGSEAQPSTSSSGAPLAKRKKAASGGSQFQDFSCW